MLLWRQIRFRSIIAGRVLAETVIATVDEGEAGQAHDGTKQSSENDYYIRGEIVLGFIGGGGGDDSRGGRR